MGTPDRVPKHFPHLDATAGVLVVKCWCGWIHGESFPDDAQGEQQARGVALVHQAGRQVGFVERSRLVSKPTYAFEVKR